MNDEVPLRDLPRYTPPEGDAPLDAVEIALIAMWVEVLLPIVREELRAAEPNEEEAAAHASKQQRCPSR